MTVDLVTCIRAVTSLNHSARVPFAQVRHSRHREWLRLVGRRHDLQLWSARFPFGQTVLKDTQQVAARLNLRRYSAIMILYRKYLVDRIPCGQANSNLFMSFLICFIPRRSFRLPHSQCATEGIPRNYLCRQRPGSAQRSKEPSARNHL